MSYDKTIFDLSILINALQRVDDLGLTSMNINENKKIWCEEVGSAQKLLPANIAQIYCSVPLFPVPKFSNQPQERSLMVHKQNWFSNTEFGKTAAYEGKKRFDATTFGPFITDLPEGDFDLKAMKSLRNQRKTALKELKSSLALKLPIVENESSQCCVLF